MKINVRIDELVLHGFPPEDRYRIAAALEDELVRLLKAQGMPHGLTRGRFVSALDAGSFSISTNSRPQEIGEQVARALFGGLSR